MRFTHAAMSLLGIMVFLECASGGASREGALARFKALGVQVYYDQGKSGKVVALEFDPSDATDAEMALLEHFPELERLGLSKGITDKGLKHIPKLRKLSSLTLPEKITDKGLKELDGLNLEYLYLHRMIISDDGMRDLSKLRLLKDLTISQPPDAGDVGATDAGVRHLEGNSTLTRLTICSTRITDRALVSIGTIKNLEKLDCSSNKLTDAELRSLVPLQRLSELSLNGTNVGDKGLEELAKIPNLAYLALSPSGVTGAGFKYFRKRGRLETLVVGHALTVEGLSFLGEVQSLRVLRLEFGSLEDFGSVDDFGLSKLANLQNLESIHLRGNRSVTDRGLAYLSNPPHLKYIDVSQTKVSEKGVALFQKGRPDVKIDR
jgi:internalin A